MMSNPRWGGKPRDDAKHPVEPVLLLDLAAVPVTERKTMKSLYLASAAAALAYAAPAAAQH
jgi:hypothetical protein